MIDKDEYGKRFEKGVFWTSPCRNFRLSGESDYDENIGEENIRYFVEMRSLDRDGKDSWRDLNSYSSPKQFDDFIQAIAKTMHENIHAIR